MPPRQVRLQSLAKINLDLRVLSRRPDGYHELRTLFQTISLADTLEIDFTPGRQTRIEMDSSLDIPDNLVVRAAQLVLETTRARGDLAFRLKKRIPLGGGLGGGSSNAAAVLLALPALTGKPLPLNRLLDLAASLGSDVPFFLSGGTAVGLGRGAELYPCPDPPAPPMLLVTPGLHLSTPDAYRALQRPLTTELPSAIINSFQSLAWQLGDGGPGGRWKVINDFETVVFSQHPQLKSIKGKLLKSGADTALMSGSGSSLFGIFSSRVSRDAAVRSLRASLGANVVHPVALIGRNRYRALWWRQLSAHIEGKLWPPRSRYSK